MSNTAAVITGSKEPNNLITVKSVPIPQPTDSQLLIKTVAYAINPTDWKHIYFMNSPGSITGTDCSGIVEKVGSKVQGFKVGDYVSNFQHGSTKSGEGAFAKYVIAEPSMTIKYGNKFDDKELSVGTHAADAINSFEGAASIPLGLGTVGISYATNLKISTKKEDNKDKYILIWGGSTATGIFAIQVAKEIYGLKVLTTASSKNHKLLKSIGADEVFDYKDVNSLKEISKYDISYILDTVSSPESYQASYDVTINSTHVKFDNLLALGRNAAKEREGATNVEFVGPTFSYLAAGHNIDGFGAQWKISDDEFSSYKEFWFELLPSLIPTLKTPNLKVLKPGFESVNEALALSKDNKVSAEKVVFRA